MSAEEVESLLSTRPLGVPWWRVVTTEGAFLDEIVRAGIADEQRQLLAQESVAFFADHVEPRHFALVHGPGHFPLDEGSVPPFDEEFQLAYPPDLVPVLSAYRREIGENHLRIIVQHSLTDDFDTDFNDLAEIWRVGETWTRDSQCNVRMSLGHWRPLFPRQMSKRDFHLCRGFCRATDLVLDSLGDGGVFRATRKLLDLYEDCAYFGGDCVCGLIQMLHEYSVTQYLSPDDHIVASLSLAAMAVEHPLSEPLRRGLVDRFVAVHDNALRQVNEEVGHSALPLALRQIIDRDSVNGVLRLLAVLSSSYPDEAALTAIIGANA